MRHRTTPDFWAAYERLPEEVRRVADKNFRILQRDPRHPSLHFKRIGRFYSVRVGRDFRSLALIDGEELLWFWIGSHAEYDAILRSS